MTNQYKLYSLVFYILNIFLAYIIISNFLKFNIFQHSTLHTPLFLDYNFFDIRTSPAPSFFPDMLLVSFFKLFTDNNYEQVLFSGYLQITIIFLMLNINFNLTISFFLFLLLIFLGHTIVGNINHHSSIIINFLIYLKLQKNYQKNLACYIFSTSDPLFFAGIILKYYIFDKNFSVILFRYTFCFLGLATAFFFTESSLQLIFYFLLISLTLFMFYFINQSDYINLFIKKNKIIILKYLLICGTIILTIDAVFFLNDTPLIEFPSILQRRHFVTVYFILVICFFLKLDLNNDQHLFKIPYFYRIVFTSIPSLVIFFLVWNLNHKDSIILHKKNWNCVFEKLEKFKIDTIALNVHNTADFQSSLKQSNYNFSYLQINDLKNTPFNFLVSKTIFKNKTKWQLSNYKFNYKSKKLHDGKIIENWAPQNKNFPKITNYKKICSQFILIKYDNYLVDNKISKEIIKSYESKFSSFVFNFKKQLNQIYLFINSIPRSFQ